MYPKIYPAAFIILLIIFAGCGSQPESPVLRRGSPASVGMDAAKLAQIDELITTEIEKQNLPGAVLLVARKGVIVLHKTYGNVQVFPDTLPMTEDVIFDMASVTKPVATATSVMILVERGQLRLMDPVEKFIPEYTRFIRPDGLPAEPIRLYHLLTHTSGLPPYTDVNALKNRFGEPCPEAVIQYIATIEKQHPPGEHFAYSCLGFITLAEIVKRVSGLEIGEFTRVNIFEPLNMHNSLFSPPVELLPRIAPTEVFDGVPLKGFVHDPLAQLLNGQSGNAGLFSTAGDLAIFAQMMLNSGIYRGIRILAPLTVQAMTRLYPGLEFAGRGLGWDIHSAYSSNMGDIFPPSSYGHTGFTGTSIVIDPETETMVILLSNRVHMPDGCVIALRSKVANVVAASIYK
ncbi:MAG: serine hydrolase domain-containing protein [Fidelibacterota bacterium]